MPLNDPAPSRRWLDSLSRSRERRRAAALRRRRRRMGRAGSTVLFVSLACMGGAALAQQSSESTGSLRTGSTGIAVEALQQALGIEADGHYGPKTARAVRRFQRRNDLPVTGVAGPGTLRALGLHTAAAVTQPGDSTGPSDDAEGDARAHRRVRVRRRPDRRLGGRPAPRASTSSPSRRGATWAGRETPPRRRRPSRTGGRHGCWRRGAPPRGRSAAATPESFGASPRTAREPSGSRRAHPRTGARPRVAREPLAARRALARRRPPALTPSACPPARRACGSPARARRR